MTPANLSLHPELAISRGAKWEHTLAFTDEESPYAPTDLTNLGPFKFTVGKVNGPVLFHGSITVDADPTTGLAVAMLTAAQTLTLPRGFVTMGIRDAYNNPYAEGTVPVSNFTPPPA